MENVRKHRDIKLSTTEKKSERKTQMFINKLVYLGLSILELSKIVIYDFSWDDVKPIYGEKYKFCYMDTVIPIVYVKTHDFYKDIVKFHWQRNKIWYFKLWFRQTIAKRKK